MNYVARHRRVVGTLVRHLATAALFATCSGAGRGIPLSAVSRTDTGTPGASIVDSDVTAMEVYFAQQVAAKLRTDSAFVAILGHEMLVRKVSYPGADDLLIPAYLFASRDTAVRRAVVVFVHGGMHGDFGVVHLRQVRALVRKGYVVLAPEYRGSSGYGPRFYAAIDYGGKEVDDVVAARDYLAHQVPSVDLDRLAILGYSHGGYIALLAVLRHPELFRAAIAHVPVADLPTRMRVHPPWYQELFTAQPAFGASLDENPGPYFERSPTTHARMLKTPVLVHVADNDENVFIVENRLLRDSMIAAGKDTAGLYTYREWHNPVGGHSFGVLDTREGRASWRETMAFLARHLGPSRAPRVAEPRLRRGGGASP
jgi:dipeptidyl aminopeptidase/acylaminoacyl peptidase